MAYEYRAELLLSGVRARPPGTQAFHAGKKYWESPS